MELVGRDRDRSVLVHLASADSGVVAVTGPPGLGKTTLLRSVAPADAVWLHGLASLRHRPGASLSQLVPSADGDAERDASRLLRQLKGRQLLVDDAQWADPHTAAVIELVGTMVPVLATWRTGDPSVPAAPPAHWSTVELSPLTDADATALARRTRPDLSPDELHALIRVAAGSPLLIEQLASDGPLHPSLVSALLTRLGDLPADVRATALLIMTTDTGLSASLLDEGHVAHLESAGLVVVADHQCWPRHSLLRESALEVADPAELRAAHASLRDLLAAGDPLAAALHALRGGELADAEHLAQRAIAEAPRPVDEARATLVLAEVLEVTDPAAAWRLRARAAGELRDLGAHHDVLTALRERPAPELDPEVAATVLLHLGASEWDLGDHLSARDRMEKGLSLVHGTRSEAELLIRAGLAMYQTRIKLDGRAAIDDARAALALAIERGQHVAFCRTRVAAALVTSGDPSWRAEIDAAVDGAAALGDETGERLAREARYLHTFVTGDLDTAAADLQWVTECDRRGDRIPLPRKRAYLLLLDLVRLADRGELLAEATRLLADEPIFSQRSVAQAVAVVAATDLGRPDLARAQLTGGPQLSDEEHRIMSWAKAELSWAVGGTVRTGGPDVPVDAVPTTHPATTMEAVCDAWRRFEAGDPVPPAPLVFLPGFAAATQEVQSLHHLVDGDLAAAGAGFDAAAAAWWDGSDRRAALRCEWGAALSAHLAQAADSDDRLLRCHGRATRHGCNPVASRARRLLRERGVRLPAPPMPAVRPLTPAETLVLRMLASGFTSDQAATTMGIELETVGDHLQSAMRRLAVASRAEAVRWIGDHG